MNREYLPKYVAVMAAAVVVMGTLKYFEHKWYKEREVKMYELIGVVKKVGELQTFASGFTKQDLVVEEDKAGSWKNVVAFSFKKDNVEKLRSIAEGMRVKVGFAIDGREWTDPKTGKVKYFSDLTALRLEVAGRDPGVPEPAVPNGPVSLDDMEEPPF